MLDACVLCVCVSICAPLRRSMPAGCGVRPCVSMCARSPMCARNRDPKKVQLGNQQCRFPFILKTRISRNLAYAQPCLYYRLAISPRCFYPHLLPVRDTQLFIRDTCTHVRVRWLRTPCSCTFKDVHVHQGFTLKTDRI